LNHCNSSHYSIFLLSFISALINPYAALTLQSIFQKVLKFAHYFFLFPSWNAIMTLLILGFSFVKVLFLPKSFLFVSANYAREFVQSAKHDRFSQKAKPLIRSVFTHINRIIFSFRLQPLTKFSFFPSKWLKYIIPSQFSIYHLPIAFIFYAYRQPPLFSSSTTPTVSPIVSIPLWI
jgi:hypothetical protein